jgi:hypothetical protein
MKHQLLMLALLAAAALEKLSEDERAAVVLSVIADMERQ